MAPYGQRYRVFELDVGLHRMRRQEGGAPLEAGELVSACASDREVRQACRELGDIEPGDAERGRGVVAEVRLCGEGIGAGVSHPELIEKGRIEEVCLIEGQTLCGQRSVLNTRHVGSEIEFGCCEGGRREAAGSLAAGERIRGGLDKLFVAEAAEERILAAQVVIDTRVAAVVI